VFDPKADTRAVEGSGPGVFGDLLDQLRESQSDDGRAA